MTPEDQKVITTHGRSKSHEYNFDDGEGRLNLQRNVYWHSFCDVVSIVYYSQTEKKEHEQIINYRIIDL